MKRIAVILFLLCALVQSGLAFVFTNEFNGTHNWSSFDCGEFSAPSYLLGGCYFRSAVYLGNPTRTNHWDVTGAGGSSWGNDVTNHLEASEELWWSTYAVDGYDVRQANDNGGYQLSNDVYQIGLLIGQSPALTYDGTEYSNQNIVTVNITHLFVGNSLQAGGAAQSNRNNGSLGLNAHYGTASFDLYNEMRAYTDDATNYYALGHYKPGPSCIMAILQARDMGIPTNVWQMTVNFRAGTAATNNCTATGIVSTTTTWTATFHPVCEAMAWDVPGTIDGTLDGTTNNATPFYTIYPALGNAFNDILQVTNAPAGTYNIFCNGILADVATDSQLAAGRNWFTNYSTPFWPQRKECMMRDRDKSGANRVSLVLHSAGQSLSLNAISGKADAVNFNNQTSTEYVTNGKRGSAYKSAMQPYIDQVRTNYDVSIQQAAQMPSITLSIVLITPRFVPYHK